MRTVNSAGEGPRSNEAVSVENATVVLPKKDLGVDEELTVKCKARSLSEGVAYGFAVSGVNTLDTTKSGCAFYSAQEHSINVIFPLCFPLDVEP
ncbi:MAG: hypothetical protein QXJ27_04790 [Thermoplasmata archaeon]